MSEFYLFLMNQMYRLGALKKTSYYGNDYALVEFEKEGKIYSVSISCAEKKEDNNE